MHVGDTLAFVLRSSVVHQGAFFYIPIIIAVNTNTRRENICLREEKYRAPLVPMLYNY